MAQITTIGAIIPWRAAQGEDHPALLHEGGPISARLLADRVGRFAGVLADAGVGPGSRVALRLGNGPGFVLAHGAASWLGATVLPLPVAAPLASTERQLALAEPDLLVTSADAEALTTESTLKLHGHTFDELTEGLSDRPLAHGPVDASLDSPALMFLTSGTTGDPKSVVLSQRQALAGLRAWTDAWSFSRGTVAAMAAPCSHVVYNPVILGALACGGAVAMLRRTTPRAVAAAVARHGVTALMAPPALWQQLLDDPRVPRSALDSLTTAIHGAAPMTPHAKAELSARLPDVRAFDCYGLTETASALSVLRPEERGAHTGTVGRAHPELELSIRDEQGLPVTAGSPGEVCCRGPHVIESYGQPDLDRLRFIDGWLRTGDRGQLDGEGFLTLLGRVDDVINVAGEKRHAAEIEAVLAAVPDVLEAGVVGLPDELKGQRVGAAVVLKAGALLDTGALLAACRAALPPSFVPRTLVLREALPRSAEGKLDRRALLNELSL